MKKQMFADIMGHVAWLLFADFVLGGLAFLVATGPIEGGETEAYAMAGLLLFAAAGITILAVLSIRDTIRNYGRK